MSTAHDPPEQSTPGGQGATVKWAWRALITLSVIAMIDAVFVYLYPWLVAYGLFN